MNLTIAYITSRKEPKLEWFLSSLAKQVEGVIPDITIVDVFAKSRQLEHCDKFLEAFKGHGRLLTPLFQSVVPKPTIWQGEHRITKEDWWAKSNAMNTAICLCQTDFIVFCDDRCVLVPEWLQCVRDALEGNYAVCGSYEKRSGMKVENGEIVEHGDLLGVDTRAQYGEPVASRDWYGGSCALPLEWCLAVNGYPDLCDSLGLEDCLFGKLLQNNGFPMKFDSRMRIIEDRTPSEIEGALKRADKNVHLGQKAKSWALVRALQDKLTSQNNYDIRNMRARILNGESLSDMPTSGATLDWYDGQAIAEME